MVRFSLRRTLPLVSTLLFAIVVSSGVEAQRKKAAPAAAKKKPAAPAPKPKPAAPAPKPKPEAVKPAEEPKPEAQPAEKHDDPEEKDKKSKEPEEVHVTAHDGDQPSLLDIAIGIKGFRRNLGYKSDIFNALPSYDLGVAPAAALQLGVYPVKLADGKVTIGLNGSFEYAFAMKSSYDRPPAGQEGKKYSTKSMGYSAGLQANLTLAPTTSLHGGVEYGAQSFKVDLPDPTSNNAGVPDVDYKYIRPNAGARVGIADHFAVLVNVGYLLVTSAGEMISPKYFPSSKASVAAVDGTIGIGYEIPLGTLKHFEIRPAIGYRRYFYKFKPTSNNVATDPYVAGGALDQYFSAYLMLGLRM